MIDYDKLKNWRSPPVRHTYTAKDVMLYALGAGMGQDPLDRDELRFVYERDLRVLPSMAAVLASPGFWARDNPELGIDYVRLVHGEQSITLHQPLPVAATAIGETHVTRVVDKGEGKDALVYSEKRLTDEATGALLATTGSVTFCRGDGGFSGRSGDGGNGGRGDAPAAPLQATPETAPDVTLDFTLRPEAAFIYRLSGDINPLHVDPDVAAKAGFTKPIMHGLGTYGVACRGLVKAFCDYDPARFKSISARFSAPAYPGDVIRLECWRGGAGDAAGNIAFRARVPARDVTVLSHGHARCI